MSLEVRAHGCSDPGQVRDNNEDSYFVGARIFCVADGLGGHQAGEVASGIATDSLTDLDAKPVEEIVPGLADAVRRANRLIYEEAREDGAKAGMGTTMTALTVDGAAAHIAHVGDSRAYLLRDDTVDLLTEDHTVVGRMVAEGMMTAEAAETHPQRSILTRALGTERSVEVDVLHVSLRGGDRLLLCSDGLTNVVAGPELPRLAGRAAGDDLAGICANLVQVANERGGPDNITVVLVEVGGTPSGGVRSPAQAKQSRARQFKPRTTRRISIWLLLLASMFIGGLLGVRAWVDGKYFVGITEGEVTIFNGVPTEIPPFTYNEVHEPTDIRAEQLREGIQRQLETGVVFGSLAEARRYVEETLRPQVRDDTPIDIGGPPE
jgi:PPM family protein phosphatase